MAFVRHFHVGEFLCRLFFPPIRLDMNTDFTVIEKVKLKPFKTYDGLKAWHTWIIDGSLLYVIDSDPW